MGKHSRKHRRARKVKKLLSAMLRECEDSSSSSSSATESDSLSDQECMEVEDQQDTPTNQDELINDRVILKEILGEDPMNSAKAGPAVNNDTASHWTSILKNGLNKDLRRELIEKYPIIENCLALCPPKLNEEISVGLQDFTIRQDNFFCHIQEQIRASVGAAVTPIEHFIAQGDTSKELLQRMVDLTKLITDLHHTISVHRKFVLSNSLTPAIKKVSENCAIDTHLFGENFSQSVKNSQELHKLGMQLKKPAFRNLPQTNKQPGTSYVRQGQAVARQASSYHLNWKRQTNKKKKKEEG
ncbi:unnamed protein product [Callosobruchus maculatus]|uniref:Uncharacterized protein n=1 Tax=Callosobruchus maculatus TaxID=64391 RepID=A0A653CG11_CALMS|nr:unnamed protein product [Callosobruchus maculatus]